MTDPAGPGEDVPPGAQPLWVLDALHPAWRRGARRGDAAVTAAPPPPGLDPETVERLLDEAAAEAALLAEAAVPRVAAPADRTVTGAFGPCARCRRHDWYRDGDGRWCCGGCTPRPPAGTTPLPGTADTPDEDEEEER